MKKLTWLMLSIAACGGNNNSTVDAKQDAPGTQSVVMGNLGGSPFGAKDAVWNDVTANGFDFTGMSTEISITDFANECDKQTTRTGVPNGRILVVELAAIDASGHASPATANGAYVVFSGTPTSAMAAEVYFEIDGADCRKASHELATSGVVTVTSATDPKSATFDATFPSGDHITGTIHASRCAALDPNSTPLGGC